MTEYFQWFEDLTDYGEAVVQLRKLCVQDLDEWDLIECKHIADWNPSNTAFYEEDGVAYDLMCTTFQVHVISKRLKELLESLHLQGVQYLPIRIKKINSRSELGKYFVLNVEHKMSCLDMDQSDYTLWGTEREDRCPGDLRDLKKAVLIRSNIGGSRIFRLSGWEIYLVIEKEVKEAIVAAGMTGCRFQRLPSR